MRRLDDTSDGQFSGVGEGRHLAIAARDMTSALAFSIDDILNEPLPVNYAFALGKCAALMCEVPASRKAHFSVRRLLPPRWFRHGGAGYALSLHALFPQFRKRGRLCAGSISTNPEKRGSGKQRF